MNKKITVEYKINSQYLLDSYYAQSGVLDKEFAESLDRSIADNMRNFLITFDDEKMLLHNQDKSETNTYYYQDFYQIHKKADGYLFFVSCTIFYFIKFDLFKPEHLTILDNKLRPYYEKECNAPLAVIDNYEVTTKRILTGLKYLYRNITIGMFVILFIILIDFIFYQISLSMLLGSIFAVVGYQLCLRLSVNRIVKSVNSVYRHAIITFYNDKLECTYKEKLSGFKIKYSEFYKIRKLKKGYLIQIQKYSFYFLFYDEFTHQQRQKLEESFKQNKNYC
ncbi:YcxB family protein [Gilliamella sp. Nev3-1]|uniref:YcxB family protein n=1 Tax=Gilliamella sp. Nev3-1 TaxID=3120250 RepID=UPI00080E80C9|nr:hypothetical protein [Gilliamella apicola]OCG57044.1 hypothetical protein A9G40_13810 [Gilliamella apicola]